MIPHFVGFGWLGVSLECSDERDKLSEDRRIQGRGGEDLDFKRSEVEEDEVELTNRDLPTN